MYAPPMASWTPFSREPSRAGAGQQPLDATETPGRLCIRPRTFEAAPCPRVGARATRHNPWRSGAAVAPYREADARDAAAGCSAGANTRQVTLRSPPPVSPSAAGSNVMGATEARIPSCFGPKTRVGIPVAGCAAVRRGEWRADSQLPSAVPCRLQHDKGHLVLGAWLADETGAACGTKWKGPALLEGHTEGGRDAAPAPQRLVCPAGLLVERAGAASAVGAQTALPSATGFISAHMDRPVHVLESQRWAWTHKDAVACPPLKPVIRSNGTIKGRVCAAGIAVIAGVDGSSIATASTQPTSHKQKPRAPIRSPLSASTDAAHCLAPGLLDRALRLRRRQTGIAHPALVPRAAQDLDAVALVVGVVAGKVAVAFEPEDGVVAEEDELVPVAHGAVGAGWARELAGPLS